MIGEIIAIGDELTSGRITNTTSGFAARELFVTGHSIRAIHTIGDTPEQIGSQLKASLPGSEFLIITGGLGSTTDDLTSEAVIQALELPAAVNPEVLAKLQSRQSDPEKEPSEALKKLAQLPEKAEVLDSSYSMAGYLLEYQGKPLFFLPGVPPQMEELLLKRVLPQLDQWAATKAKQVFQKVYKTFGLHEPEVNKRLLPLEQDEKVQIGYYPVGGEVHVSLTVKEPSGETASPLFDRTEETIYHALGDHLFGTGTDSLASVIGELLTAKNKFLCTAESCTGGLIGSKITAIAGSSLWYAGGVTAYSNQLKELLLNVDRDMLVNYGAVSAMVARAMAARLAAKIKADLAISVTGIAGPDGGSPEKPVGTVYIGLYYQEKVEAKLFNFRGNRQQIQEKTALTALDMVRRVLLEN